MHSIQADGTLGSPHVEAHGETMGDVVVHSLFYSTTKLCSAKREEERRVHECFQAACTKFEKNK